MKIQCIDRDIRQILESGTYMIPRFQRPFSWDKENVDEFWSDSIAEIKSDYFIGSFVTFNITSSTYGVVDGQQRLTTITIILCVIRDKYSELGYHAAAKGIHRLIETRDLDDVTQFVLRAETSYPYLQSQIQSFNKELDSSILIGDEEKAVKTAYETINYRINEKYNEFKIEDPINANELLKNWIDQVRDKILALKVISITLDNQDDAYTIFETINTRGKELTAADLAKNHILRMHPQNSSLDRPKDFWHEMQNRLESCDISMTTFLHHYWLSKHSYTTEKLLFKSIRNSINAINVKSVFEEIRSDSSLYSGIFDPDSLPFWTNQTLDIKDSLYCISNILNIKTANSFILTILRLYSKKILKDGQVRELFSIIEKYHYTYTTICTLPSSGGIGRMYSSHARTLAHTVDPNEVGICISDFKRKIKERIPAKDVFCSKFKELSYKSSKSRQRDIIRYTLWKIDQLRNPAIISDRNKATIEHILPQASNNTNAHLIGNLVLVPAEFNNKKLKTKSFTEKKKLLVENGYKPDDVIESSTNWADTEILSRTEDMAAYAYDHVWKIK